VLEELEQLQEQCNRTDNTLCCF